MFYERAHHSEGDCPRTTLDFRLPDGMIAGRWKLRVSHRHGRMHAGTPGAAYFLRAASYWKGHRTDMFISILGVVLITAAVLATVYAVGRLTLGN